LPEETSMQSAMKKAGLRPSSYKQGQQGKKTFSYQHGKNILQNRFLDNLLNKKQIVEIKSIDGITWSGILTAFDDFSVLIEGENGREKELIFKHSIRSIKPS
jgi:RNA chaperone Hfq